MKKLLLLGIFLLPSFALATECSAEVRFDTARWWLRKDAKVALNALVACVQADPTHTADARVSIEGNADPRPYSKGNGWLSKKRAEAVEKYLSARIPGKYVLFAHGNKKLRCVGTSRKCLAENRRVDVKVVEHTPPPAEVVPVPKPPVVVPPPPKPVPDCRKDVLPVKVESPWHKGPYAELGFSGYQYQNAITNHYANWYNSYGEVDVGLHAHYLPYHVGGRVYYAGNYGVGAQLQGYILQGAGLEVHVDVGLLYTGGPFSYASVHDVRRRWDVQYGLGLEYPLRDGWVIIGDVRASQPLWRRGEGGWDYQSWNVVGNAAAQSRALVGLMYRF